MISTQSLSLSFGQRILFEDVSVKFTPGNCYGLIGANGAGKSTFVKILSGEIDPTAGGVVIPRGLRMSVLKQDHFAFDDVEVLTTVLMGFERLYQITLDKEAIYAKDPFTEEDGIKAGELEEQFSHLNGWEAESQAGELLCGLGIPVSEHSKLIEPLSKLVEDKKPKFTPLEAESSEAVSQRNVRWRVLVNTTIEVEV